LVLKEVLERVCRNRDVDMCAFIARDSVTREQLPSHLTLHDLGEITEVDFFEPNPDFEGISQDSEDESELVSEMSSVSRRTPTKMPDQELPQPVRQEIAQFQINGYAEQYFRRLKKKKKNHGFERRAIPIEELLQYQKKPIEASLIKMKPSLSKNAVSAFNHIVKFMDVYEAIDRQALKAAREILLLGIDKPELRDELYCQLVKQLTNNPVRPSEIRGWKLMALCLQCFPPTKDFELYLGQFIVYFVAKPKKVIGEKIAMYADYSRRALIDICELGRPASFSDVNVENLEDMMNAPFETFLFKGSIQDIMQAQKTTHPELDLKIPFVVKFLTDKMLSTGLVMEGLFRVPGKRADMNKLKEIIEQGRSNENCTIDDPHVHACLLKQWFKETKVPLVPPAYYYRIIEASQDITKLMAIIKEINIHHRTLIYYMIDFLRKVAATPENLMNEHSLSIVMSPNFLRCPNDSADAALLYTKKESESICTLLKEFEYVDEEESSLSSF